ncbi:MATE efflux family protein 3 [Hibiscus syriacus]|uniref:MATE efflux family protein 3 n=1 Tax=Hibiscus syriacus TaxID=106335 RepID=A0A6A2WW10_HIBSY|nr:protein ALTERED PHOSPHATE STARVATION RESPONSE 1-like [Hibiscus syriacus]KAE8659420.1 MATE efflux family protein 3 [Hibiscus syriacus]
MGCSSSKLDDLPAVALCRERCTFLEEAIQQRFALAEAHLAYTASLKLFGQSLNNFIEHDFGTSSGAALPPSPLSPNKLKNKEVDPIEIGSSPPKKGDVSHHHSHSNSGSHLHFLSDSDEDDSGGSLHHSSPLHDDGVGHIEYMNQNYPNYGPFESGPFPGGSMHTNFMKKQPTPSIVYEQRPMNPETVYMGESSSSPYYPYSYASNFNPNSGSYLYSGYPNYGGFSNYSSYSASGYGSSLQPSSTAVESYSKPPPPPPSPPRASAWDFLNPFESFENYYPPYTPSRDSKEVREEEGIPDLEDEDFQHEVVKEVDGDQKFVDSGGYSNSPVEEEDGKVTTSETEASLYQARPSVGIENDRVENEVHVVVKKAVDDERAEERGTGSRGTPRDVFEVIREIQVQFMRASESGNELAKLLEVGTLPYKPKHVSKILHVVTPSLSVVTSKPSTSKTGESSSSADNTDPTFLDFNEKLASKPKNLSSTLHKLYLWEKKLYNEVKAEEKMRVAYDKKSDNLKRLDQRGAEASKIDSTRNSIRSLSTKIRIAIQVVDKISVTINKIRDEELWPLLNELIEGLNRMWKSMLECHRSQCQMIREAKTLGLVGSRKKLSDDHLKATLQLEHELISWTIRFSSWISAQKGYVRGLNNWLLKCLNYEPEVTDDGIAPFSPSRVGAPPIFVICNQWSQAMDRISEREVIDSMWVLATSVLQLWEQDKSEMHRWMMSNKDLERKARSLDREDQKLQKGIQALEKIVLVSGDGNNLSVAGNVVHQSETSNHSLQGSLQHIFEAMEKFSSESSRAYDELLQRVKERIGQEHERVS